MLGLVVATNIFQMYIFWELVGVSSYLLIGFFYKLPSAVLGIEESVYRYPFCRPLHVDRYTGSFIFLLPRLRQTDALGGASAFNFLMLNSESSECARFNHRCYIPRRFRCFTGDDSHFRGRYG